MNLTGKIIRVTRGQDTGGGRSDLILTMQGEPEEFQIRIRDCDGELIYFFDDMKLHSIEVVTDADILSEEREADEALGYKHTGHLRI